MNLYQRNKLRTNRKLVGKTEGLSISHGERGDTLGGNFPAGKWLGISFEHEGLSFISEMDQKDAQNLMLSLAEFVKR